MRFLVEDNSMAVITGAGAEYGEKTTTHIHYSFRFTNLYQMFFASIYRNTYGILQSNTELYINPTFFLFQPQLVSPRRGYSGQTHQRLSPSTHADDS